MNTCILSVKFHDLVFNNAQNEYKAYVSFQLWDYFANKCRRGNRRVVLLFNTMTTHTVSSALNGGQSLSRYSHHILTQPPALHKSWKILPGHMFKLCIRLHTKAKQ